MKTGPYVRRGLCWRYPGVCSGLFNSLHNMGVWVSSDPGEGTESDRTESAGTAIAATGGLGGASLGLVVGTVPATPLQFSVGLAPGQYAQLDDVVVTERDLPG